MHGLLLIGYTKYSIKEKNSAAEILIVIDAHTMAVGKMAHLFVIEIGNDLEKPNTSINNGRVVKLVDAPDLKSDGPLCPYEFEARLGHFEKTYPMT